MNRRGFFKMLAAVPIAAVAAKAIPKEDFYWDKHRIDFIIEDAFPGTIGSIKRSTYPFWSSKPAYVWMHQSQLNAYKELERMAINFERHRGK